AAGAASGTRSPQLRTPPPSPDASVWGHRGHQRASSVSRFASQRCYTMRQDTAGRGMRNLLVFAFVLVTMGSVALSVLHREFAMPQGDCAYLETIRIDSAEDDAKDAIEAKDFHLLSVGSASPVIPGLPDQSAKD